MNTIIPNKPSDTSGLSKEERDAALHEISQAAANMEKLAVDNGYEFLGYLMKMVRIECERNLDPENGDTPPESDRAVEQPNPC